MQYTGTRDPSGRCHVLADGETIMPADVFGWCDDEVGARVTSYVVLAHASRSLEVAAERAKMFRTHVVSRLADGWRIDRRLVLHFLNLAADELNGLVSWDARWVDWVRDGWLVPAAPGGDSMEVA